MKKKFYVLYRNADMGYLGPFTSASRARKAAMDECKGVLDPSDDTYKEGDNYGFFEPFYILQTVSEHQPVAEVTVKIVDRELIEVEKAPQNI